jgi:putative ABC transport system substrate-binding protein
MTARAQQPPVPVVGYLDTGTPEMSARNLEGFRRGLGEAGFVDGRNVTVVYRWGNNDPARVGELVDDLVHRRVAAIASVLAP